MIRLYHKKMIIVIYINFKKMQREEHFKYFSGFDFSVRKN